MSNVPEHEVVDGVDLDGPATERTARALYKEAKSIRRRSITAFWAAMIAIVSCLFTGWSVNQQRIDRCKTGNNTRAVIRNNNTGIVNYVDTYALALGIDPDFDISKLPESQRKVAQQTKDKLNKARKNQLDKNNDPAVQERNC